MNHILSPGTIPRQGEPTDAPPGSPRKIHVLTERASRREALFHPKDNLKRVPLNQADEVEAVDDLDEADLDLVI